MVNIKHAAEAAITAFELAVGLGRNNSVPVSEMAAHLAPLYLPTYTGFSLGKVTPNENRSYLLAGMESEFGRMRELGIGTDVRLIDSRVEVVSPQSALCWMTLKVFPPDDCIEPWSWTNVFGFRATNATHNGLGGGFEFAIGDQEHAKMEARFPNF